MPVHIVSVADEEQRSLKHGAVAYLKKPVSKEALDQAFFGMLGASSRRVRKLLVVDDNELERNNIVSQIGGGGIQTTAVSTGAEALVALKAKQFDCMVLDLILPDMSGLEVLDRIQQQLGELDLPVAVYTSKTLDPEEEFQLKRRSQAIIVKDPQSPERLLAETSLFLYRVETDLPDSKKQVRRQIHETDPSLAGKKVLVVDDDLRNIFALTAILERQQMEVLCSAVVARQHCFCAAQPGNRWLVQRVSADPVPECDDLFQPCPAKSSPSSAVRQLVPFRFPRAGHPGITPFHSP